MIDTYYTPHFTIKIVQEHEEGERVRTHSKRRINKKWLKRYGVYGKQKLDKGQIIEFDRVLYMSRLTFRQLVRRLNQQEGDIDESKRSKKDM